MKKVSAIDQNYKLWVLLQQTADVIFEARGNELRQYGLPPMQAAVLFVIQAIGDEATPAKIARWMLRRPHSISMILDRMVETGLIRKTKDLHRKNLIRVTLTEKGQQLYNQSLKRKPINRIMSSLSEEERQQLRLYLQKLRDKGLKEVGMDPKKVPFPKFP